MPEFGKKFARRMHREGFADLFPHPAVKQSIAIDIRLIDEYDRIIEGMKDTILRTARNHDAQALSLLRSVPGIGKTLSLILLYEIRDIDRFERVQDFCSYARLIKCAHESAGKRSGKSWRKERGPHRC